MERVENFLGQFHVNEELLRWPLMSPYVAFSMPVLYVVSVLVGQRIMRKREKPITIPTILQALHNGFLVLLSLYMSFEFIRLAIRHSYGPVCNPVDTGAAWYDISRIVWIFMASKIYEFLDTFLMVLRKNDRQITFLHVYHHASIFVVWWMNLLTGPGSEAWQSCLLNSIVHVVMYSYYFITTVNPKYQCWWKRYITQMQMIQFCLFICQGIYLQYSGCHSKYTLLWKINTFYAFSLLILFVDFYKKGYKQAQQKKVE